MKDFRDFGIEIPSGRRSGKIKCFCPECHSTRRDKRDKSLSVDLDKGVWNCHYCGWGGTINGKEEWEKPWHNNASIRRQKPEYTKPKPKPTAPLSDKVIEYFKSRGISQMTLEALKVTSGMEWMPNVGQDGKGGQINTIQFNFYLNGELVNVKYRDGYKHFRLIGGAQLIPYNIDAIKGKPECVITEGEIDALSFHECGRTDVISVPNGANSTEWLDDFLEEFFDDKEVIFIASDTDTKGVQLRDELMRRFGPERCRVLSYGEGCKDANEHLIKYGKQSLLQCIADAPETKLEGVFQVSDFEDSLDALFEHGMKKGVTIGHDCFDRLCSFETKRLCVVTGIPGSGKSEFIDEIAECLNMRYGWRFAYFSPENAPLAYHASKLIEKFTGKKFDRQHLTHGEYRMVKAHIESNFFFISPKDDHRLETILEKAKSLVRRKGIKALVIDPFNRLEDESDGQNETKCISRLLDRLTNFAQQNNVLVILMVHPVKMKRNSDGQTEVPTLYDCSGSANFFNKTDFGIVVHRNRVENTVEVHVQKVKFRHLGECGMALFKYNLNNGRYVPFTNGIEPQWDNTNHLVEEQRRREQDAAEAARFDFDGDWMHSSDEPVPF